MSDLHSAILTPHPHVVRHILDNHAHALRDRPSCDKDGWSPLHVLAKSGDDYISCFCEQLRENGYERQEEKGKPNCFVNGGRGGDHSTLPKILTTYGAKTRTSSLPKNTSLISESFKTPPHPPWAWASEPSQERHHRARMAIVYMLCDAGVDINGRDASGFTPLHYAARRGDAAVCDALLQCGADLHAQHDGVSLLEEVEAAARSELKEKKLNQPLTPLHHNHDPYHQDDHSDEEDDEWAGMDPKKPVCGPAVAVQRVFRFYWPGLWRAVASENISKVRQLVNSWCRVDLHRGGMSLRELAVSTGNETIISLLLSIQPSMCLVHHSLAGNVSAVRELLESPARKKINVDIRKLSERGAPLLFFLILIFTALESWMEPEVVKSLLPAAASREARLLERVWNRGKNVLTQAIENDVHMDAIEAIVEVGGPSLLCERDPEGKTVVDVALKKKRHDLIQLMDRFVAQWLTRPDLYPRRRDLLALRGFGRLEVVAEAQESLEQDIGLFLQEYRRCQGFLQQMFQAVKDGETARAQQLLYFESDIFYLVDLLWQGRLEGDGMPLLHWAVLYGREQIVNLIVRAPQDRPAAHNNHVTPRRTPLHYASGLPDGGAIVAALLDLGSSEHALDMDGREPLDFRDARGSPALLNLMDNLRNKIYEMPHPDPWDPEILRSHLDNLRRERFQNLQPLPHHHSHHHHHQPYNKGSQYSSSLPGSHKYQHELSGHGWPYPAHFPTAPGSNFHWPLPHPVSHSAKEQKGNQRLCCIIEYSYEEKHNIDLIS
ncbi:Ankyrin repeat and protein kinase domain-containing protein 1-like 1, partial [Homarus americanus]